LITDNEAWTSTVIQPGKIYLPLVLRSF
jgi:hypothetical protein